MPRSLLLPLFTVCLGLGTWVGFDQPSGERLHAFGRRAAAYVDELVAHRASPQASPGSHAADPTLMPQPDLGDAPSMRPWPELNPSASVSKAWMVAEGPAYKKGSGRRLVTLTFDDGPFPDTTPTVLKALAEHGVTGTFFVIGSYLDGESERAEACRETLRQVASAGHLIGNHTKDHVLLTSISHTQVLNQIDESASSIERVTGKRPILFRPPFGKLDEFGRNAVRERGLDLVLWSVEKQDIKRQDSHAVFRELVSQIEYKQGGIVLLHDVRASSVAVLRELLDWLELRRWDPQKPARFGYDVVALPAYLREVAASPLPYATRDALERVRESSSTRRTPLNASKGRQRNGRGGVGGVVSSPPTA